MRVDKILTAACVDTESTSPLFAQPLALLQLLLLVFTVIDVPVYCDTLDFEKCCNKWKAPRECIPCLHGEPLEASLRQIVYIGERHAELAAGLPISPAVIHAGIEQQGSTHEGRGQGSGTAPCHCLQHPLHY